MRKKILSLVLAGAMVAGVLTGCGNNNAGDTSQPSQTQSTENPGAGSDGQQATNEDAIANLIAATEGTVSLTVWASEEDQTFTQGRIDDFKALYPEIDFNITLGAESESKAKDDILVDVEAAPDVFAFADDQINELVKAGALQPVVATYTYDVVNENVAGSIDAASIGGQLYAYPMTADNGYFMFYDSSVFTEDDMKSLDTMIEKADAAGRKIAINASDAWYLYTFFKGAGLDLTLNDDQSNTCTWNAAGGTDVAQAILDLFETGVVVDMNDGTQATAIAEGTICACVNGTWRAETAQEAWGENYAAAKLPTFTVAGKQVQMSSFSGYKLIGVNPYSKNVGWSMILAEFLTNYDSQVARYEARGLGPANIQAAASDAVQSDPAIAALAAQAAYATPQRVGGNYWAPAQTLGQILASGNPDGTDLQKLLDDAVAGINAPVQ